MDDRVDWDIVRPELREHASTGELLAIIGRAYQLLPPDSIPEVLGPYVDYAALGDRQRELAQQSLHEKVTAFHTDSVNGRYYDPFAVNSRNFMDRSAGTETWIDEAVLFFERAAQSSQAGSHREARAVFELLWDLMHRIDRMEDIVFFADEHGSWQVWVDYRRVLPAYFASLVATAEPADFGPRVLEIIERHDRAQRDQALAEARAAAADSDAHLQAIEAAVAEERKRRRARRKR